MPVYSTGTADHAGGGEGLSSAMGPKDGVGWDGIIRPQEQSVKTVQEASGPLCPRKPQGYVLLKDGIRTWSHPEHPRQVSNSPPAVQSSEVSNDKSLSCVSRFHVVPASTGMVAALPRAWHSARVCRHHPIHVHPSPSHQQLPVF